MKHINTQAIILKRTEFEEAGRIITFLTPDHGKVRGLARGVRKQKSKLAGGLELFSVSEVSFLVGRGEVYTITSTRLVKHYGAIVKDLDRTNSAYEFIKLVDKNTEDHPEPAYFYLLNKAFESLDDEKINLELIKLWFSAQLLKLAGHSPNLDSDTNGSRLDKTKRYNFDFNNYCFKQAPRAKYNSTHIQLLRLAFKDNDLKLLPKVNKTAGPAQDLQGLAQNLSQLLL